MDSELTPKQIIAATVIASGKTKKEAAELVEVTPQTISKWMQIKGFEELMNNLRVVTLYEAQDQLRSLAKNATNVLADLLSKSKNERVRLDAAKYLLDTIKISPTSKDLGLWAIGTYNQKIREARNLKDGIESAVQGEIL